MKDNFEEKTLSELCYERFASWSGMVKLRSSTSGAAQYLEEGHKFPDLKILRKISAEQTERVRKVEEMRTEIMEAKQTSAAYPVGGFEHHTAQMVLQHNVWEIEAMLWKGNAIEYGNQKNSQQQVSEAEKYVAKGDIALGAMLAHIRITIDHNLEILVDEAMVANMGDKSVQINVALDSIKEVMRGDSTLVREKLRTKLSNVKHVAKMKNIPALMDVISGINIKHKQSMEMFQGQATIRQSDLKRQMSQCIKDSDDKDVEYINIRIKTMSEDTPWEEVKKMVKEEMVRAHINSKYEVGAGSDGSTGSGKKDDMVSLAAKVTSMEKQLANPRGGRGVGVPGRGYNGGRGAGGRGNNGGQGAGGSGYNGGRGTGGRGIDGGRRRGDQRGGRGEPSGGRGGGRAFAGNGSQECWKWTDTGECPYGESCRFSHEFGKPAVERGYQRSAREKADTKRTREETKAYNAGSDSDKSGASGASRGGSPHPNKK
jgi:hypothetical protein